MHNALAQRSQHTEFAYRRYGRSKPQEFFGESIADYITRQPSCLEQRFEEIYAGKTFV